MRNIEFRFVCSPPDNHAPVRARALVTSFSCAEFSFLCSPQGRDSFPHVLPVIGILFVWAHSFYLFHPLAFRVFTISE